MMFHSLDDPTPPPLDGTFRRRVADRVRRRRRTRMAAGGAMSAVVLGLGAVAVRASTQLSGIERLDVAGTEAVETGEPVTILAVGTDGAAPVDGRSAVAYADAVVLARVDPTAGTLRLMSVPRDLDVGPPEGPTRRLAHVMADGGIAAMVDVVEGLGFPIDHVAVIDMGGFAELVDRAGGIQVHVDAPLRDRSSGLEIATAGCHRLSGADALALVRGRRVEVLGPDGWFMQQGDADRTDRQREVVALLFDQLRASASDPVALDGWATWAGEHLQLDRTLGDRRLIGLARELASLETIDAVGPNLPVTAVTGTDGAQVLQLPVGAAATAQAFSGPVDPASAGADASPLVSACP